MHHMNIDLQNGTHKENIICNNILKMCPVFIKLQAAERWLKCTGKFASLQHSITLTDVCVLRL